MRSGEGVSTARTGSKQDPKYHLSMKIFIDKCPICRDWRDGLLLVLCISMYIVHRCYNWRSLAPTHTTHHTGRGRVGFVSN